MTKDETIEPSLAESRSRKEDRFMKLVADARARYDAMTPEQKADHDKAQRESWVRGMTGDDGTTTKVKPPAAESGFEPDWKLSDAESLAVNLSLALHKHVPGWGGATDEQLDAVAKQLLHPLKPTGGVSSPDYVMVPKDLALRLENYLYNGFEPDNQSAVYKAFKEVCEAAATDQII